MTTRSSLAFRLFAGAAAWAFVLLLVGAIALTTLFQRSIIGTLDTRLESVSGALIAAAETRQDGTLALAREPSDPAYGRVFSGRYWQILDAPDEGETSILLASRSLWDENLYPEDRLIAASLAEPGQVRFATMKGPDGETLRLVAQSIRLPNRPGMVVMLAAEDRGPADRQVRNFAIIAALMFVGFAAAIAAGVFFQVRIGLAPVLRMRDSVADVREGMEERVEGDFPVELQPLANELNAMLDHSRELVERSRTHVGNLAHALKTPIAVLTNESHSQGGELAELVKRQTGVMAKQVDHHLRRARAAAHAKAVGARTPVHPVVDDLARTLTKIYSERGIRIETDVPESMNFRGERQDLEEMAGNLMDNACKWATSNLRVSARPGGEGQFELLIEDDGPGLDEEGCETALQRGVRLDEQAPGTGLGLAIVADLAKAYEGEVELARSELGGLRVCVSLPLSPR